MTEQLNTEFAIPGAVVIESGNGGLDKIVLSHPSGSSTEIYLLGAHVASWRNKQGEEQLFLSKESGWAPGVAIRGGIPVCWPQFGGAGALPNHGIARINPWTLVATEILPEGDVAVTLRLTESEATLKLWPHRFEFRLRIRLSATSLGLALQVSNTDEPPFDFQIALHAYFGISDIHKVAVRGLQGVTMLDVLRGKLRETDALAAIRVDSEINRIYLDAPDLTSIRDEGANRSVIIAKDNMQDMVVWNPWKDNAIGMADFGDEEYLRMICVETGNITSPVHLRGGQVWQGETVLSAD